MKTQRKILAKKRWYALGHTRCVYCCTQLNYARGFKNSASIEHIIPSAKGGSNRVSNILICCVSCNLKRRDMPFDEFVIKHKFPRQEWLLTKYDQALLDHKRKIVK